MMAKIDEADQDRQLVTRILDGNIDIFGKIMERYEAKLLRFVVYLIHDEEMAQDVVQETFIKTYRNLHGFKPKHKFSSWIYRIAHNEAMNAIKKNSRQLKDVDLENLPETSQEDNVIWQIDQAILQKNVHACLSELEAKYREVLMLIYYENMSYADISEILHVPISTVGVWASRGKTKLKAICQQKGVKYEAS